VLQSKRSPPFARQSRVHALPALSICHPGRAGRGRSAGAEREQAIVRPATIVALGATAARSVLGKVVSVLKVRGRALVTIHPSFLLRIKYAADKKREFRNFVRDLRISNALSAAARSA
jgi:hypothetical protein